MGKSPKRRLGVAFLLLAAAAGGIWAFAGSTGRAGQPAVQSGDTAGPATTVKDAIKKIGTPKPARDTSGKLYQTVDNMRVVYTLDPALQELIDNIYDTYKVPYGAFVAVEPATGRVLAMAEYSAAEPGTKGLCLRATYPAASLIKVVTSAAALKTGKVNPYTVVRYDGSPYRLTQAKVMPRRPGRERLTTTLTEALGKSNNVVFAKMGADVVGAKGLEDELADFCFNKPIPFDFDLQKSTAIVPSETYPLARTAAGFGDVYLSPLHAALIAATVANGGTMMKPYIVDSVTDASGNLLYSAAPSAYGKVIDPELARTLSTMMTETVKTGTGSKIFNRYAKKLIRNVVVAGKTGSLTGEDPPGRYEWFIGFAPVNNPRIAVASLVVNKGDLWHIKGTYAAAAAMKEHFGM